MTPNNTNGGDSLLFRAAKAVAVWLIMSLLTAVVLAALVSLLCGMMETAAWLAWGDEKPAAPWFLYRFLVALVVVFSPLIALGVMNADHEDASTSEREA